MKSEFADLHLHSKYSDGYCSPKELIEKSVLKGLHAIAIVDHDDISALPEAIKYGQERGVEVITGVELSVHYRYYDLHILAYCFDHENNELVNYLNFFKQERVKRAKKIVHKLIEMDMPISFDEVQEQSGVGSIGRPHIANLLVAHGYVYSYQEAFNKYLGDGKPANVQKYEINLANAFALVEAAGGVSSIAHPGLLLNDEDLGILIKSGVKGIEAIHPKHNKVQIQYYCDLARRNNLVITGGSDFHGRNNGEDTLGKYNIPYEVVIELKELANRNTQ